MSFLAELRDFLRFLKSLWGVLTGLSLLFPLSNTFLAVIPIAEEGVPFWRLRPETLTAMTMVVCIFVTFATFSRRERFRDPARRDRYGTSARITFVVGVVSGALYLLTRNFVYDNVVHLGDSSQGAYYANRSLYEAVFAVLYITFFALLTRAFLVLAMLEYYQVPKEQAAVQEP